MALLVAAAAAAWLYAPVVVGLLRQWMTDDQSAHGLVLVAAAAFVVYRRWGRAMSLTPQPTSLGLAIVAAGLAVFCLGTLTGEIFVVRASMPLVGAGALVTVWGLRHLRSMAAPFALLVLAIPLPAVIVTQLTLPLQLTASQLATGMLDAAGVYVVRDGNLLTLSSVTLEVADACSGLRALISLISISAVCGVVFDVPRTRMLLLIAAVIPIAIVGNALRIATTGLMASAIGERAAEGLLHDATGYAAFVAMLALVIALQVLSVRSLRRRRLALAPA